MNQNVPNTLNSDIALTGSTASEAPTTELTAYHVICVDLNSVDREHGTIDPVELWVIAGDYDGAVSRAQDFMGPGWVVITVMSKDVLSDCAGYLAGFEEDHETLVMEAAC